MENERSKLDNGEVSTLSGLVKFDDFDRLCHALRGSGFSVDAQFAAGKQRGQLVNRNLLRVNVTRDKGSGTKA